MRLNINLSEMIRYFEGAFFRGLIGILPLVTLFYLIFWVLLKKRLSRRRIQHRVRNYKKRIRYELVNTIIVILMFSLADLILYLFSQKGWIKAYLHFNERPFGYWLFSICFLFVFHDAWFYWTHRLLHNPFLFRRIHYIHHYSNDPNPFSSFSMHPAEAIVLNGWVFVTALLIPIHFLTFAVFQVVSTILNIVGHLGYEVYPKGFLDSWFFWKTTSTHHNLHHSTSNSNYGLNFTWWDKWMRTEAKNYKDLFRKITEEATK
ncbi:C-5 sterol desaturase [Hydrobacter penzbergensis]|uniref:C-5 sterol desaturase n=1 Tax=Hydrobacter penzbergensis TaxID=1235997 RepID=A0A8X8IGB8_9BACT|nr:sterol desaturase family protein [Hydrobacter penzbergensis]SDX00396.1 C-5 sterol desaturase [Hydrobacter penzbergensis]